MAISGESREAQKNPNSKKYSPVQIIEHRKIRRHKKKSG